MTEKKPVEHDEGDLEQYAGEVIPDPWDDPKQTDWPMNPEGGVVDGVDGSAVSG